MGVKLYKDCGYDYYLFWGQCRDLSFFGQIILIEVMAEISEDELEAMMERKPTVREAKVDDHALMVKALEHPVRRKMIKTIGVFGKNKAQLKKEIGVDDTIFNFQIDFLTMGNYLKIEGEIFRLNDRGLVLLSNI
jgi:hypothetical protein